MTRQALVATQIATPNIVRGILLMMLAGFMFVVMDSTAKYLSHDYPVGQIVWARYLFHLLTLPFLIGRGSWVAVLRSQRPGLQVLRSLFLLGSTFFFFLAVKYIPLATATAIGFVGPLLVTALSVPLLGEKVGFRRWAAVVFGFGAVLVIIRPGAEVLHWAVVLPLLVAFCFAFYQITTRILSRADSSITTLFYSGIAGIVVMTALLPVLEWRWPDAMGWAVMAFLGLMGSLGHLVMIRAFTVAPASSLAPFSYLQLVWATVLGLVMFNDWPDAWTFLGAAMLAASGLYVLYRERQLRGTAESGTDEPRADGPGRGQGQGQGPS
jgi:drug/metabolite transporter (DMT)-like permease